MDDSTTSIGAGVDFDGGLAPATGAGGLADGAYDSGLGLDTGALDAAAALGGDAGQLWLYCLIGAVAALLVAWLAARLASKWTASGILDDKAPDPLQPVKIELAAARNLAIAGILSALAAFGAAGWLYYTGGAVWHPIPCGAVGVVSVLLTAWAGRERGRRDRQIPKKQNKK